MSRFRALIFVVCMLKTSQVSQETELSSQGGSEPAAALPPSLLESRLDVSSAQTIFFPPNRGIRYTEEGPSSEDVVFATQSPERHKAMLIFLLLYF